MNDYRTGDINQAGKRLAKAIFQIQLGIWGIVSVIALVSWSKETALASSLGALTAIIPQRFLSLLAFAFGGARAARYSVRALQFGESVKMLLTMVMLILIFTFSGVEPRVVLLSYIIVMLPVWFGPLILKT